MAQGHYTIGDEFVRKVLSPFLLICFVGLSAPVILGLVIIIGTSYFSEPEPTVVLWATQLVTGYTKLPQDLLDMLALVFPGLVLAICLKDASDSQLSRTGRAAFVYLLIGMFTAFLVVMLLDPADPKQFGNLTDGNQVLAILENGSVTVIKLFLTYVLLVAGFNVNIKRQKTTPPGD